MNRPDPETFARASYYLAFVSSGILTLAMILGFLGSSLSSIMWLCLLTSAIGTFTGYAARADFKRNPPEDGSLVMRAMTGLRINLGVLIVMILASIIAIILVVGPFEVN